MSEKKEVQPGQVYLSVEDAKRFGRIRHLTVKRVAILKRVYDSEPQFYAACGSEIKEVDADCRTDMKGLKRTVFVAVKRLLSSDYKLIEEPAKVTAGQEFAQC